MPRENILVVEDEEEIQELVRYNLAKEGYSVTCAGSGEEALQKVRRQLPELVVLDLMLPGLDGLEVCKALKGDAAERPWRVRPAKEASSRCICPRSEPWRDDNGRGPGRAFILAIADWR